HRRRAARAGWSRARRRAPPAAGARARGQSRRGCRCRGGRSWACGRIYRIPRPRPHPVLARALTPPSPVRPDAPTVPILWAMSDDARRPRIRSTTVVCVRRGDTVALGADGQVSMGNTIMKSGANKVRSLAGGTILGGFAGSAADGLTLFELLEAKLESVGGNFTRACVELAKDWRQDR